MFSCEICEIFKNTYFEEQLQMNASDIQKVNKNIGNSQQVKTVKYFGKKVHHRCYPRSYVCTCMGIPII